ncbi:MAG: hypothetical protein IT406_02755 [Candidatus Yanofskybacteria bacterium]|nr:hypothetical protein [Candidatus Yanofskybacteria bacterium]
MATSFEVAEVINRNGNNAQVVVHFQDPFSGKTVGSMTRHVRRYGLAWVGRNTDEACRNHKAAEKACQRADQRVATIRERVATIQASLAEVVETRNKSRELKTQRKDLLKQIQTLPAESEEAVMAANLANELATEISALGLIHIGLRVAGKQLRSDLAAADEQLAEAQEEAAKAADYFDFVAADSPLQVSFKGI